MEPEKSDAPQQPLFNIDPEAVKPPGAPPQEPQDKTSQPKLLKSLTNKGPEGGFDATPLQKDVSPGYTVKITFHRATNLPIADLASFSSDPYVNAVLVTSLPKRHKEDPDLTFRTHTVWGTTNPQWDQTWYVANIPASGFQLKARIYDEDMNNKDDRLGNVHINVDSVSESWDGIHDKGYKIKKRSGSKRAYFLRAMTVCMNREEEMSGDLFVSIEVVCRTPESNGARAYTTGRNYWCKHHSPMLGRLVGNKAPDQRAEQRARAESRGQQNVPRPDSNSANAEKGGKKQSKSMQRYNFEANQFQLKGPIPEPMYHRFVEFRPFVKSLFTSTGVRGLILNKALQHQHRAVYNFNRDTLYGVFDGPCPEMTAQFLDSCHYAEGGRIFTYVLTLDGLLRFTETGKEFGVDLLSKHTMHSDRSVYIAFSGEFFIRRQKKQAQTDNSGSSRPEYSAQSPPIGVDDDPMDSTNYELVIDNDSGTYRPNAALLPQLQRFLSGNFPGLKVRTLDCQEDAELMGKLKSQQRERKKREGRRVIYTQASRASSFSSSDEERLDAVERRWNASEDDGQPQYKHKLGEAVAPFVGHNSFLRSQVVESSDDQREGRPAERESEK